MTGREEKYKFIICCAMRIYSKNGSEAETQYRSKQKNRDWTKAIQQIVAQLGYSVDAGQCWLTFVVTKKKNLVWHSENFILSCITV